MRRRATPIVAAMVLAGGFAAWLGWISQTQSSVAMRRPPAARLARLESAGTGPAGSVSREPMAQRLRTERAIGASGALQRAERATPSGAMGGGGEWVSSASREGDVRSVSARAHASLSGDQPDVVEDTLRWLDVGRDVRGVLAHARGRDLAGPRALALWRVEPGTGQAALLARSRSRADGSFAFERLLVSPREVHLVVAGISQSLPAAESLHSGQASAIATLSPARLPPPKVAFEEADRDGSTWQLRMHAVSRATLQLDDPGGASRRPVQAPARFAGRRNPTLRVAAPRGERLLIAQQTADGRSSGWVAVGGSPVVPLHEISFGEPTARVDPLELFEPLELLEPLEHVQESP